MSDFLDTMNARISEANLILKHITDSEQSGRAFNKHISIQKALVFLMCYNVIEMTVYLSLEWLFDEIMLKCQRFSDLNANIKAIFDKYYSSPKYSGAVILYDDKHRLSFEQYSKIITTFSGNLDARKVREILKSYDIDDDFHANGETELLRIKNYRNKLAHGESSFNEIGRNYATRDIEKVCTAAFQYLDEYGRLIEDYITQGKYLAH